MLQVTPQYEILLAITPSQKLVGKFTLANTSNNSYLAYKIKCTSRELFNVHPYKSIIDPNAHHIVEVETIMPIYQNQQIKNIMKTHKFMIQYVFLEKKPSTVEDGVAKIVGHQMQCHKLYLTTNTGQNNSSKNKKQDELEIGSKLSFRTANYENQYGGKDDLPEHTYKSKSSQLKVTRDQENQSKFQHLKAQIQDLERQRSELIMKAKPNKEGFITLKMVILFVVFVVLGNLFGKLVGVGENTTKKEALARKKKQQQDSFFNLDWILGEEEPAKVEESSWKFW